MSSSSSSASHVQLEKLPIWQEATAIIQKQPAIPSARLTAAAMRQRFNQNKTWQTEQRDERLPPQHVPFKKAAVLIGLQPDADQHTEALHVVLTQRSTHLTDHAGEIAFPGGRIDDSDSSAASAALREAQEEIGLQATQATVLGELLPYATGTGFCVIPVVALLQPQLQFTANPAEVHDIFSVPLHFLMNPANHNKHQWIVNAQHRREWFSMPYTEPDTHKTRWIWGATAGILRDLYRFLSA